MVKLLISGVTYHTPQNNVSDTITHVTLNTINGVVFDYLSLARSLLVSIQRIITSTQTDEWKFLKLLNLEYELFIIVG